MISPQKPHDPFRLIALVFWEYRKTPNKKMDPSTITVAATEFHRPYPVL